MWQNMLNLLLQPHLQANIVGGHMRMAVRKDYMDAELNRLVRLSELEMTHSFVTDKSALSRSGI
jgi:hypothetical protein